MGAPFESTVLIFYLRMFLRSNQTADRKHIKIHRNLRSGVSERSMQIASGVSELSSSIDCAQFRLTFLFSEILHCDSKRLKEED